MKESAIFFINSLQNGGAERVVQNQVAELCRRNVEVYVFTIHDKTFYSLPDSSKKIVLFKNVKGIRKVLSLPVIAFKLDKYIKKIKSNSTVILMTAHLPYAHNVMKFSKYSNEFLYVMHNPQFRFKNSGSFFFKMKFNFFYKRKKLVGVTQGITEELIKNYKCEKKYVTTIYNPIDFKNIDKSL